MGLFDKATKGRNRLIKGCTDIGIDKRFSDAIKIVSGAGIKASGVAVDVVKEGLDSIAGQKMYDLVQERLAVQDQYNDVLAAKLHEALERIEALEQKIHAKE